MFYIVLNKSSAYKNLSQKNLVLENIIHKENLLLSICRNEIFFGMGSENYSTFVNFLFIELI